ncbi:MAG: hypothetical protein AAF289_12165 [Cyanobacteria bacterium P01_A01_bin.135]
MNTPAHIVLNLLFLGRADQGVALPVICGAILPDLPMFVFYGIQKLRGIPERVIWRQSYYEPGWQNFIDLFNSIPLILVGLGIAWWLGSRSGILLAVSMLLHIAGDLPLHHDDGHRHFFPLSDWRFESPVSYWDPNHYGGIVTVIEVLAVIVGCALLLMGHRSFGARLAVGAIAALYMAYFAYVVAVWA